MERSIFAKKPSYEKRSKTINIFLQSVRTLRQAVEWGARPIDLAHDYNWLGAKEGQGRMPVVEFAGKNWNITAPELSSYQGKPWDLITSNLAGLSNNGASMDSLGAWKSPWRTARVEAGMRLGTMIHNWIPSHIIPLYPIISDGSYM